ncbi:dimethyladenosine transferase 2, mitochondrial [Astyanax mexicanus]|uniref:dimethyladenosine transferase 2, mitochondrial n=1 Tax=Astyanax mexicanus TaxID=7994 RepID=UPI0020CB5BF5|nr:dimethyladenosine transferase 2, mitochondrial [Astyanax mexicanus]XP_049319441.1 dimethyladenosine transferase 2, mitochondrial [Astyanax mexicanus]
MAVSGGWRLLSLAVCGARVPGRSAPVRVFSSSSRVYSSDSFPSAQWRVSGGGAKACSPVGGAQRNLSAVAVALQGQRRPLSRCELLDLGSEEENTRRALTCKRLRRFIIDPNLARLVTDHLSHDLEDTNAVIFEVNPGPGVLTRMLLNCGAQRVVALECDKSFLPDLQVLEGDLDGQLEVLHCDFFKLDPIGQGSMKLPAMYSNKLFSQLGITAVPWTSDVPVKVVGMFSQRNERNMLWKLVYALFERQSIFRYGRVELIMFISEKNYSRITAREGKYRDYRALSVLFQMSCEVQLLHQVPWSSFLTTSKSKNGNVSKSTTVPNDHMCLVRVTPRADLFSSGITQFNSSTLMMMVKQCLIRRAAPLADKLNAWSPGCAAELLLGAGLSEEVMVGDVSPDQYRRLFELMELSDQFSQSWLYTEILENTCKQGYARE